MPSVFSRAQADQILAKFNELLAALESVTPQTRDDKYDIYLIVNHVSDGRSLFVEYTNPTEDEGAET